MHFLYGSDEVGDTTPPTGPPVLPHRGTYGGSLVSLSWTAGDVLAATEIGVVEDGLGGEPAGPGGTVGPGITYYETGVARLNDVDGNPVTTDDDITRTFWVRHSRGGEATVWVGAP